jgi:hypothetical protein
MIGDISSLDLFRIKDYGRTTEVNNKTNGWEEL